MTMKLTPKFRRLFCHKCLSINDHQVIEKVIEDEEEVIKERVPKKIQVDLDENDDPIYEHYEEEIEIDRIPKEYHYQVIQCEECDVISFRTMLLYPNRDVKDSGLLKNIDPFPPYDQDFIVGKYEYIETYPARFPKSKILLEEIKGLEELKNLDSRVKKGFNNVIDNFNREAFLLSMTGCKYLAELIVRGIVPNSGVITNEEIKEFSMRELLSDKRTHSVIRSNWCEELRVHYQELWSILNREHAIPSKNLVEQLIRILINIVEWVEKGNQIDMRFYSLDSSN